VTFWVISVWVVYGLGRVDQFLFKYARYAKTSNFVKYFVSAIVCLGSIRVLGLLSGEHISGVRSGMGPGCPVRVSDLVSVLTGLVCIHQQG